MQIEHVVMILSCDAHAETIRQILDESGVGTWVVMPGEQARRAGHLQYKPLWPSTSPHVIFGFAGREVMQATLPRIVQALHSGKVCPTCRAYTWEAVQTMTPDLAQDPVCGVRVNEKNVLATAVYGGDSYYFCSCDCKAIFDKAPGKYAPK